VTCDGVSSDLPLRDISVKKMQMRDMILIRLVDHMTSTITLFTTCIYILIKQFLCFLLQKSFTDYMPGDSISIVVKNTEKEVDSLFKR
jgi:hypothetical protein